MAGATATTRTTMPTPPSHWLRLRHSRMASGSSSMVSISVAPVVVNPLMLSKKASVMPVNVG